jgi:hypothetical protein
MPFIATNQRRPTAPIELGANRERVYYFTPSNPKDPGSVHVAEVSEEDFDHLIKIEGYFAFRGTITPAVAKPVATPTPARPPTPEEAAAAQASADAVAAAAAAAGQAGIDAATAATAAAAATAADAAKAAEGGKPADDAPTSAEIDEAAQNLLALSWQKLGSEIAAGGIPNEVAQRALDIELAKPEVDQKLTIIKKLRSALGAN